MHISTLLNVCSCNDISPSTVCLGFFIKSTQVDVCGTRKKVFLQICKFSKINSRASASHKFHEIVKIFA